MDYALAFVVIVNELGARHPPDEIVGLITLTPVTPTLASQKMSGLFQRDPRAGAFLGGDRVSGQDIRDQNGLFFTRFF